MQDNRIAKRYAAGLIKSITDKNQFDAIRTELKHFLDLLDQVDELKAGMETALLSQKQKTEILDAIHQKLKFNETTHRFLSTVLDENRLMFLEPILQLLDEMWLEQNGIEKIKVFSVIPLEPSLEHQLKTRLSHAFNKEIIIEKAIDSSLIAGIKIQRGLVFYDFSIDGNLKKLKELLVADHHRRDGSAVGDR
ncbi:MAG: ATP synthase F1 subunit delta [Candidatus Omnitrophota bacterium]